MANKALHLSEAIVDVPTAFPWLQGGCKFLKNQSHEGFQSCYSQRCVASQGRHVLWGINDTPGKVAVVDICSLGWISLAVAECNNHSACGCCLVFCCWFSSLTILRPYQGHALCMNWCFGPRLPLTTCKRFML